MNGIITGEQRLQERLEQIWNRYSLPRKGICLVIDSGKIMTKMLEVPYMKDKVTICTGSHNVVFAYTKHPEEAMEWLKWYYQEENSWSLIEAGTWMPILDSWYTDAEKTDKWIDNPNFPDKDMYKSAVVDYAKDNMVSTSWYYVNGTDEFNATLDTVFSNVWAGQQTMQEAIDENLEELQGIYEANNQ